VQHRSQNRHIALSAAAAADAAAAAARILLGLRQCASRGC
jgi:hypothetical protein